MAIEGENGRSRERGGWELAHIEILGIKRVVEFLGGSVV